MARGTGAIAGLRPIDPDSNGDYPVTMEEVGHIELRLGAAIGNCRLERTGAA